MKPFPPSPNYRRAILVLSEHELEKCKYEGDTDIFRNPEAYVLKLEMLDEPDLPPALEAIRDAGLGRPNKLLVQSPFDSNLYLDASEAALEVAISKYMHFSTLCAFLGATEVSIEQIEDSTEEETFNAGFTFGANVNGIPVEAGPTCKSNTIRKLCSKISLYDEYFGGEPDIQSAESLLRRTGLIKDQNFMALLDMRRGTGNMLRSRKLILNLTSEVRDNLQVIANLHIPKIIKIGTEYTKGSLKTSEFLVTINVKF